MDGYMLNNGVLMPALGLGTFTMSRFTLVKVVIKACKFGYTSFDTSAAYGNEKALGYGIKLCGKKRTDIFITTKLSNTQQRSGNIDKSIKDSLRLLNVKYIDLYLMHWPNTDTYLSSWIEMEKLYKQGFVRAIGVCNFHQHHFEKLFKIANITPVINQIEIHPLLSQKKLIEFCKSNTIQVEAYSPLARMYEKLIKNELLIRLAIKYSKTVEQIILRWDYQNDIITIPKTQNYSRLKSNIDIFNFTLDDKEIKSIDNINEDFRVRNDPDNCDFSKL